MNAFLEPEKCDFCDKRSEDVSYRELPDCEESIMLCNDCYNEKMELIKGIEEEEIEYENSEFVSITECKVIMDIAQKLNII